MRGVVQTQSELRSRTLQTENNCLPLLLSKCRRNVGVSDSLKKIARFSKKTFNLPLNTSCQLTPPQKYYQPNTTTFGKSRPMLVKVASPSTSNLNSTALRSRCLRTEPCEREQGFEEISDLKELAMSTECSQRSLHQEVNSNRIQQYALIRMIGRGKSGQVFLAVHRKTGFVGALKIIEKRDIGKLEASSQQKMKKQLRNQIKIQAFLDHPNLVKLYDFFYDQERVYMFMELGNEGHLFELLAARGKFEEETTSIVTRQIVQGVSYMHDKGVIHRDVKLENVVFTCGMAKLCDFGWSVYEPKNFRSTICGTPLYLPPEILKGKKYNEKVDVWAIGTLGHEMATGRNPFGIRKQSQLSKIVWQDFEMRVGSPKLRSFFSFILRKEPESRPTAEVLLAHPFIEQYIEIETAEQLCQLVSP